MTRTIASLALLGLLIAMPLAVAQDDTEPATRPDDAAWVDDCPPEMFCAAESGASVNETPNADCDADACMYDEPTRGPADGSCENCRGNDEPIPYGPDGCIECSGAVGDSDYREKGATLDKAAPGVAALGVIAAFVVAVALAAVRK